MGKGANNKSSFGLTISDCKSSNPEVIISSAKASIGNNFNLDRPFDGGGGGRGPTGSNGGGANEVMMVDHIHKDHNHTTHPETDESSPSFYYLAANAKNSQPFHVFSSNSYKTPGEMVPLFTNAQWTELERQAMIYKYMISSLPVPPHLIHAMYNNNNKNKVEAGRCKRTDGKKWRCSRDVAPHQKYCERHLHRGRPRSRKPVENHKNTTAVDEKHKKPRLDQQNDDLLLNNAIGNREMMKEGALLEFAPSDQGYSSILHQDYYYDWEMQANNGPMMGGWVDRSHNEEVLLQDYVKMDHEYEYFNSPPVCWGPLAEAFFRNPSSAVSPSTL